MRLRKIFTVLFINLLTFLNVKAAFDIDAKTVILQDYLSGDILYEKEPDLSSVND